jgi:hypothetical protein
MSYDKQVIKAIVDGLGLLPWQMNTQDAWALLLTFGMQESLLQHRRQLIRRAGRLVPEGPAKGLWQFERGGGCKGIVEHHTSRYWTHHICKVRGVQFNATGLWNGLETDDVLAAAAARLLIFTDPHRLPVASDERGAWNLYIRVWRPGAWTRGTPEERAELRSKFQRYHAQALAFVSKGGHE